MFRFPLQGLSAFPVAAHRVATGARSSRVGVCGHGIFVSFSTC